MRATVRTLLVLTLFSLLPACAPSEGMQLTVGLTGGRLLVPEGGEAGVGVRLERLSAPGTAEALTVALEGELPQGLTLDPAQVQVPAVDLAKGRVQVASFRFKAAAGLVLEQPVLLTVSVKGEGGRVVALPEAAMSLSVDVQPRAHFALEYDVPPELEAVVMMAEESVELPVRLVREAGHTSAVHVEAVGLPDDAMAEPLLFEEGQTEGMLVIQAGRMGTPEPGRFTLVATDGRVSISYPVPFYIEGTAGRVNPAFGEWGSLVLDLDPDTTGDDESVVALVPQGESSVLLVAEHQGMLVVMRLLEGGIPDESFAGGEVSYTAQWRPVAAQADEAGRLVVLVEAGGQPGLLRLTADGLPDETFGTGGMALLQLEAQPRVLEVLANGDLLVGSAAAEGWALARVDPAGAVVPGFGSEGVVFEKGGGAPMSVFEASDFGLLFVAGTREVGGSSFITVASYGDDGALSDMLLPEGLMVMGGSAETLSLHVFPDGALLLGGQMWDRSGNAFGALRIAWGGPDFEFASEGFLFLEGGALASVRHMAVLEDGSFILSGESATSPGDVGLARFDIMGTPDFAFGPGGATGPLLGPVGGQAQALTVLQSGALLVGASVDHFYLPERDLAVVSLFP